MAPLGSEILDVELDGEAEFTVLEAVSGWESHDCTCPEFCELDHANE